MVVVCVVGVLRDTRTLRELLLTHRVHSVTLTELENLYLQTGHSVQVILVGLIKIKVLNYLYDVLFVREGKTLLLTITGMSS